MIFTVCLDLLLTWIDKVTQDDATARACADDLGAALAKLEVLTRIAPVFIAAQDIAGLTLKPSKCVIVPLLPNFNDKVADL